MLRATMYLVLCLIGLFVAPTAHAADPTTLPFTRTGQPTAPVPQVQEGDFFIHGNDRQLWIAGLATVQLANNTTTSSTRILSRSTANAFDVVTTLNNRFIPVADWNDRLVLLSPEGAAYRIAYPGGSASGISPPAGLKFATLTVANNTLFAVLRDGARLLPARLAGGTWQVGKPFFDIPGRNVVAAGTTTSGEVVIAIANGSPAVTCYTADATLSTKLTATIAAPEGISELRILTLGNTTGVWASPGKTSGGTLWKRSGDGFIPWIDLGPVPGELVSALGRLRFIFANADKSNDQPMERCFDEQGVPLGAAAPLAMPSLDDNGSRIRDLMSLLAMIALGVAVVSVLRQGGELELRLAAYERLDLASRGKRLLAGLIDHSPWIAVLFYFAITGAGSGTTQDEITANYMAALLSPTFVVLDALSIAVVITHTLMFELIAGRTVGKMLIGLTTVTLDGQRPAPLATLLRNLLRIVDLVLIFSWLSVLLNPLRQTVGDSTARTVVVERRIFKNPDGATPPSVKAKL